MLKRSISRKKAKKPYLRGLKGNRFSGMKYILKPRSLCTQREGGGSREAVRGTEEVDDGCTVCPEKGCLPYPSPTVTLNVVIP